ncbi:MAG TPA: hypothetical protein VK747_14010, partial [Blastocatellia bacterium]|nr:hypothetical protein [Blastocatellia bacterium]
MRRIQILTLAMLLCLVAVAPRAHVSARKQRLDPRACAPGEVIVKLRPNALALSPPDRAERLTRVRSLASENNRPVSDRPVESLVSDIASDRVSKLISGRGLDRVFVLKFDPNADLDSIIGELRSRDDVEYAEPNYRIKLGTVPANDPGFSSQWSLMNLGVGIDIVVD